MQKKHLAIFSKNIAEQIFIGKKTIETRFSAKRISPFGQINKGDLIYIKPSGEEISGQCVVRKVISFEELSKEDFEYIKEKYGKALSLGSKEEDEKYFEEREDAKYGTVIFLDKVERFVTAPIKIPKKDLRGWVVLD